jgi:hypothetical protein
MTREEAVIILDGFKNNPLFNDTHLQAFNMAISALSENKGEWKRISPAGIYECSECGQNVMTSDIECYKFCHGCGASMKGGE